jgi:hypothetical protein
LRLMVEEYGLRITLMERELRLVSACQSINKLQILGNYSHSYSFENQNSYDNKNQYLD